VLDFQTWQELVLAYARIEGERLGFTVEGVKRSKTTRSVYLQMRAGTVRAVVRVSDHRSFSLRRACFSVRRAATGKLHDLAEWLTFRRQTGTNCA
jgi:hypothetical protein